MPRYPGIFASAASGVTPTVPEIRGSQSLAADPSNVTAKTISLAGQSWTAGDYAFVVYCADGGGTINAMSGATNDTFVEVVEIDHASGGSNLAVWEGTISSPLDASISVTIGATRDSAGGMITVFNAAANASQPAVTPSTNQGENLSPICSAVTTPVNNCLVFAIMNARGGHFDSPPTPPTGWQLLFAAHSQTGATLQTVTSLAIAYKQQEIAGSTGDATWTNALGASQRWTAIQFAVRPA